MIAIDILVTYAVTAHGRKAHYERPAAAGHLRPRRVSRQKAGTGNDDHEFQTGRPRFSPSLPESAINYAAETEMPGGAADGLTLPCRGPIAVTITGRAQV